MGAWTVLIGSLFDPKTHGSAEIPGGHLEEWLLIIQSGDLDDVDRLYIEAETIGG